MDRKEVRKRVTESVSSTTKDEIRAAWHKFSIVALSVFCVVLGVILVVMMKRGSATRVELAGEQVLTTLSPAQLEELAVASIEGFLRAETVPARARFVMDPRRVMPLMEDHYERYPMLSTPFKELKNGKFHIASGREFFMGTVVFENEAEEFWIFERTPEDEMKLQWEVAVGYAEKDWNTFVEDRDVEGSVFRVTLKYLFDEPYFNYDFTDPDLYECFLIRSPRSDQYVYGYLEKNSEAHKTFNAVRVISNLTSLPVIASLRFPDNAHGEQVFIDDILNFSWVEGVDM